MSGPLEFSSCYRYDSQGRYLDISYLNHYFLSPVNSFVSQVGHSYANGRYFIYDSGLFRAHSLNRKADVCSFGYVESSGYARVSVRSAEGHFMHESIHRLVALAFCYGYSEEHWQINHIDENKSNNHHTNLEFCTPSYNNEFGSRVNQVLSKTSYAVGAYHLDGSLYKEFPEGPSFAARFLFPNKADDLVFTRNFSLRVSRCIRGLQPSYKGFIWRALS